MFSDYSLYVMIETALQLARKLGERLASHSLSRDFVHTVDLQQYASIEIISYKHLEDSIS